MADPRLTPDVIVIGAGLAGLSAARQAVLAGLTTTLVAKGWGSQYWHTGGIDVIGYHPIDSATPVTSPLDALTQLISQQPDHPYAVAGHDGISAALTDLQQVCTGAGYPLEGSLDRNWLLPSGLGGRRPTCLAPSTMTAGDLSRTDPMLVVGLARFPDLAPGLVAGNLEAQGTPARGVVVDPAEPRSRRFVTAAILAELYDRPKMREELAREVRPHLSRVGRVGFPAVLGLSAPLEAVAHMRDLLGVDVFEIPTLPPSVPGMRLHRVLVDAIRTSGGRVIPGAEVVETTSEGSRITAVLTEAAARRRRHRAARFVLASGGILGGGVVAGADGEVREVVFGLPLSAPGDRSEWFESDFLDPAGHAVYRAGVRVDASWRPVDGSGGVVVDNLVAAGTVLAHCEPLRERSLDGVALATGFLAGRAVAGLTADAGVTG